MVSRVAKLTYCEPEWQGKDNDFPDSANGNLASAKIIYSWVGKWQGIYIYPCHLPPNDFGKNRHF
jgi:hypothetical protein